MFTKSVEAMASRLRASLEHWNLDYVLYEVPSIHRSISPKGSDDISFSKAHFIKHVLATEQKPVLYLDADTVVREFPAFISDLATTQTEFAIYNWLADPVTDAYAPVTLSFGGKLTTNRFYRYSHSIDLYDPNQLICSGAVQFYANTAAVHSLLSSWLKNLNQYPGVADDELLDLSFNRIPLGERPRSTWLTKEYCRYAWWIYVRPVIDHPQFPAAATGRSFRHLTGQERFDPSRVAANTPPPPFPRNALIDVDEEKLLEIPPPERWSIRTLQGRLWR